MHFTTTSSFVIFQALKLDLDYRGEKISALSKELEELQLGGGASEEELNSVKRQKNDLEMRLKDQVQPQLLRNTLCNICNIANTVE